MVVQAGPGREEGGNGAAGRHCPDRRRWGVGCVAAVAVMVDDNAAEDAAAVGDGGGGRRERPTEAAGRRLCP